MNTNTQGANHAPLSYSATAASSMRAAITGLRPCPFMSCQRPLSAWTSERPVNRVPSSSSTSNLASRFAGSREYSTRLRFTIFITLPNGVSYRIDPTTDAAKPLRNHWAPAAALLPPNHRVEETSPRAHHDRRVTLPQLAIRPGSHNAGTNATTAEPPTRSGIENCISTVGS